MPSTQFRTAQELNRSKWAEKYTSVGEGVLYTPNTLDGKTPFPIHEYLKLGLLGKNVRMVEVNAGSALIDQMVADTMTEMMATVGDKPADEILEWWKEIDFYSIMEEACQDFFRTGYATQNVIRDISEDAKENTFAVTNIDPSCWYPDLPTFTHQKIRGGRIISVFKVWEKNSDQWYAFVEHHTIGNVEHKLYELEGPNSLEGKEIKLSKLEQFAELDDKVATGIELLPITQVNRKKSSRKFFGESVLTPIWDILQEVSEIQTQIRSERIKHFRARLAAAVESLQRAQRVDDVEPNQQNSKQRKVSMDQAVFDMNQEVLPVPAGAQMPQYIQRDLQTITIGSQEINNLLSRAASIVGVPRSIFNLDEKGSIHVETEKKKDRRYTRHIFRAQQRMEQLAKASTEIYWQWKGDKKELEKLTITLAPPFQMSQEEKAQVMREMNPTDKFVSQKRAIREIWPDMSEEEREKMQQEIKDEQESAGLLANTPVELDANA
ncbi:hypothetical protein [Blastopirellula marina]|uniref:Portal protein n=1 Tax=Blastopirellula marina TaxID=124 RepID=A0A2S8GSH7_9BACT|nr:hypothetical protein [Blastopirellula marina]PQO47385.1 hypothetical protein C5Y93_04905 [Blastopirellula marina]